MFSFLPLIAYEYARRALESQGNETPERLRPPAEPPLEPISFTERLLEVATTAALLPPAPIARWFGKVVQDNVDFARMLSNNPVGTLEDFGRFLLDSLEGEGRGYDSCLPYLLLGEMVFPPVFALGSTALFATPDTFMKGCRNSESDLEDLAKAAVDVALVGAMPLIGFAGAKLLSRGAQAARAAHAEESQEKTLMDQALEVMTAGPLSALGIF